MSIYMGVLKLKLVLPSWRSCLASSSFLFVSQRNLPVCCFQLEDLRASISLFWRLAEITPHEILYGIFSSFACRMDGSILHKNRKNVIF